MSSTENEKITRHRVEITQRPGIPYDPNQYAIGIRTREEVEPHLQLLREYVQTCPIETHENVGFMIGFVSDSNLVPPWYSAMLPPIILRWVQARPEVEYIGKVPLVQLS